MDKNQELEHHIKQFEKDNSDIIEALEILKVSSKEYLEALQFMYGMKKSTASSTSLKE